MSDLPVIPNQSPVTIPAREATAYGECYIVKFVLGTADAAGCVQPLTVTFRPYNYALEKTLSRCYAGRDVIDRQRLGTGAKSIRWRRRRSAAWYWPLHS